MIYVAREPGNAEGLERCCFCRALTAFWYVAKDVACCEGCATAANDKDVPSKQEWVRRERIASRRFV